MENGSIHESWQFRGAARLLGEGRNLKAGEYRLAAGASMAEILDMLTAGQTVLRSLTIPEGLTVAQAVVLVAAAEGLREASGAIPAEGYLLPETYYYERGTPADEMIARMGRAMTDLLEELWAGRAPGLPLAAAREALILASIVEKETARAGERARIAAVFLNRLRRNMRLQSDPTVVYALTGGAGPLDRRLKTADLEVDSPYNTYREYGLPPGPIALAGEDSLRAVLHPADTDELYFVADGTGGHAFAKTLAGHQVNVRRWRRMGRR